MWYIWHCAKYDYRPNELLELSWMSPSWDPQCWWTRICQVSSSSSLSSSSSRVLSLPSSLITRLVGPTWIERKTRNKFTEKSSYSSLKSIYIYLSQIAVCFQKSFYHSLNFGLRGLAKVANMLSQGARYSSKSFKLILSQHLVTNSWFEIKIWIPGLSDYLGAEGHSALHANPTPGVTFDMSTFFTQVSPR